MKIVFFGSSDFSLAPAGAITKSPHELTGVVTVPPAQKGRGRTIQKTEIHEWAEKRHLRVWAPEKLKDAQFLNELKDLKPEVFVVCSYGKILPRVLLDIPIRFALNVHPSLLPLYRGAAPINWQLIRGETFCGLSFFRMDAGMDSGDIVWQERYPISPEETSADLSVRLSEAAAENLPGMLGHIEKNEVVFKPQDHSKMTLAPKLSKADGKLDWNLSAEELHNRVRGLLPWPCAFTTFRGETVRILKTVIASPEGAKQSKTTEIASSLPSAGLRPPRNDDIQPGQILAVEKDGAISVATGKGALLVCEIQRENRKPMSGNEFANGARLQREDCFVCA